MLITPLMRAACIATLVCISYFREPPPKGNASSNTILMHTVSYGPSRATFWSNLLTLYHSLSVFKTSKIYFGYTQASKMRADGTDERRQAVGLTLVNSIHCALRSEITNGSESEGEWRGAVSGSHAQASKDLMRDSHLHPHCTLHVFCCTLEWNKHTAIFPVTIVQYRYLVNILLLSILLSILTHPSRSFSSTAGRSHSLICVSIYQHLYFALFRREKRPSFFY